MTKAEIKINNMEFMDDIDDEERQPEIRLIEGDPLEGETITVEMIATGKRYTRKVRYSREKYGDLYITINGMEYPFSAFLEY